MKYNTVYALLLPCVLPKLRSYFVWNVFQAVFRDVKAVELVQVPDLGRQVNQLVVVQPQLSQRRQTEKQKIK